MTCGGMTNELPKFIGKHESGFQDCVECLIRTQIVTFGKFRSKIICKCGKSKFCIGTY